MSGSARGPEAGESGGGESWRDPETVDIAKHLRAGENQFAVLAVNETEQPSPAGLLGRYEIAFEQGEALKGRIDGTWKAANQEQAGWEKPGFDDKGWAQAKEAAKYGQGPWGVLGGGGGGGRAQTLSPVKGDPFHGRCELPADGTIARSRVYVEMDEPAPESAARVTVNGRYAGGFIGGPCRVEITKLLKSGENKIVVEPFAPKSVRVVVYGER
jgi:hypothetical protein